MGSTEPPEPKKDLSARCYRTRHRWFGGGRRNAATPAAPVGRTQRVVLLEVPSVSCHSHPSPPTPPPSHSCLFNYRNDRPTRTFTRLQLGGRTRSHQTCSYVTPGRAAHKAPVPQGRSRGLLYLGGRCAATGQPSGGLLGRRRGSLPGGHFVAAPLAEPEWPEPAGASARIGPAGGREGRNGQRPARRCGAGPLVQSKAAGWVPGRRGLGSSTSPPAQVTEERPPGSWDPRRAPRRQWIVDRSTE